jgi:micrococcal nuclease
MLKKKNIKYIVFIAAVIITIIQTLTQQQTTTSKVTFQPTLAFTSITPISKQKEFAHVVKVVDGDTIDVVVTGSSVVQKVRYIGIDTPETVSPKKPIQCFGREASNKNKELVSDKDIYMIKDVSETDRYGRLLRYVYIPNGNTTNSAVFVNDYLVKEGYAHAATFPPDVAYQELFKKSEEIARQQNKGLWSACPQ